MHICLRTQLFESVEKLYYSAGYDPMCIYCAAEDATELIKTDYHVVSNLFIMPPIVKRKKTSQ